MLLQLECHSDPKNEGQAYLRSCPFPKPRVHECGPAGDYLFVKVTMAAICKLFVPLVLSYSISVFASMHLWAYCVCVCVFDLLCIQRELNPSVFLG